jgi:AbrB family looped-hinge helix DNA binding protein
MSSSSSKSGRALRSKPNNNQEHLMGATVVGERGQVVIPKDVRERMCLKPGDKLMVMVNKQGPIMLIPIEQMQRMIRQMSEQMSSLLDHS